MSRVLRLHSINNHLPLIILVIVCNSPCDASVVRYTNKALWQTAVSNNYSTVDFVGYPHGTFITTQYSSLGVVFTDENDSIFVNQAFPDDGVGLDGNGNIAMTFSNPQLWIAVDFPGGLIIQLYQNNALLYTSLEFGGSGIGFFGGLVSTEAFDRAVLIDPTGEAEIDNLYFGPPIPASGAPALFGLAAAALHCRARRRRFAE